MTLEPTLSPLTESTFNYVLSLVGEISKPTPKRLLKVLCDGRAHSVKSLVEYLPTTLGTKTNLHTHFSYLRTFLEPYGFMILCEVKWKRLNYRMVRVLPHAQEELLNKHNSPGD